MNRSLRALASSLAATVLLVATAAPASAVTTVALWHMNEASGPTMSDSSGSGNVGTLQNVTRVAPGFNGSGRAYSFNGTSSRVIVPNSSSLSPGSRGITISAHVKFGVVPPPSVGDYDLVRKQTGTATYKMEILGTGRAYCQFRGTNGPLGITRGPNLADNAWHTIICKKTSSSITLTVDGTSFIRSGSVGSISNTISLVLGGKPTSGDWYQGLMDEVKIVIG